MQRVLSAILVMAFIAPSLGVAEDATPVEAMKTLKGFQVERLYNVPEKTQGSWVNMTMDPKGRLIVSDQYGKLHRVTLPALGTAEGLKVEPINAKIGEAQGLLWAFDSLYVMVNTGGKYKSGLYRVRDTDGDDKLDSVEMLRLLDGRAEHGPHAVVLAPDGKSIYVVCGDRTRLTKFSSSRVPEVWDEDLMLPRVYGRGFMRDTPAPGGWIGKIDPDGKNWELIAVGFRNEYDAAFNLAGDLFSYDADMEWDMNTPWYRPTRICEVVSGAEFGWRNSSGKWPAYYPDSVPAVVDIGPGSPTGVSFGYGAKFPAKYQQAMFCCDWSYGKLYAVHLEPAGASYKGIAEEFVTGVPLPLTDVVINPKDGAMYFAIGGRRTTSGLYRVTYHGSESTKAVTTFSYPDEDTKQAHEKRRELEAMHHRLSKQAIDKIWPSLSSDDRFIRYAARVALEHQDPSWWQDRALTDPDPWTVITSMIALARVSEKPVLQTRVLGALNRLKWKSLDERQKIALLRAYELALLRLGKVSEENRQALIERLDPWFPAGNEPLNAELCQILVYLQSPTVAKKAMKLLADAPTQEEQINYAKSLRLLKTGWTKPLREDYFRWFHKAMHYRGGASFTLFVRDIQNGAVANLTPEEKKDLEPLLELKEDSPEAVASFPPREVVKEWKLAELEPIVKQGLSGRDFERGRKFFGEAKCFACHRFDNQGGAIGPDLTALSGRFNVHDLLESIVDPSKTISDQYTAVNIATVGGDVITGRIVNLKGDTLIINTNMLDPNAQTNVKRGDIEVMKPSTKSMMPEGLLNTFKKDEILDLMAYLLSRGNAEHEMFEKK